MYLPGALLTVGAAFRQFPEIQWLTSLFKVQWDSHGRETRRYWVQGFSGEAVGHFLDYAAKLIGKGDLSKAVDSLKKVIESAPGRVKVREQLAQIESRMRDLESEKRTIKEEP